MLVHKNSNVYWNARILETGGSRHKTLSSASRQGRPLALKAWPQTSTSPSLGNLVAMQILRPQNYWIRNWGWGPANWVSTSPPPGDSDACHSVRTTDLSRIYSVHVLDQLSLIMTRESGSIDMRRRLHVFLFCCFVLFLRYSCGFLI